MMKCTRILFLAGIFFSGFVSLKAQQVNGHWYGTGKVDMPDASNNYMSELIINQKAKTVTGTFSYYFRDSLFTNKVEGTYNDATRALSIKKQNIIYYRSTNTKTGVDCPMYGEMILISSKTASTLKGYFVTDEDHKYACPSIIVTLKKSNDTLSLAALAKKQEEEEETAAPTPVTVAQPAVTPVIPKAPVVDAKQVEFIKRGKTYLQQIEMEGNEVKIELYDNGQIDYDSVSIFLNDKQVVPSTMLNHKAISITLALDTTKEFNDISMFADNVGMIPPNTAALIIYDGKIRYEIMMSSDLDRTAAIRLKRKKKKDMMIVEP